MKIPCIQLMKETGYIRHDALFFWRVVQPFFGNAYEFMGSPGHVAAFVVADSQDAVGPRVVQGIEVQVVLLQNALR